MKTIYKILFGAMVLFSYAAIAADKEPIFLDFEDKANWGKNPIGTYKGFVFTHSNIIGGYGGTGQMDMGYPGNAYMHTTEANIVREDKSLFDFNGFNVKSAVATDVNLIITGYENGVLKYTENYYIKAGEIYTISTSFVDIDRLFFDSTGKGNTIYINNFFLDNMSFNGAPVVPVVPLPVPEPSTYAMMFAGLGMIGFVVRKRKAS